MYTHKINLQRIGNGDKLQNIVFYVSFPDTVFSEEFFDMIQQHNKIPISVGCSVQAPGDPTSHQGTFLAYNRMLNNAILADILVGPLNCTGMYYIKIFLPTGLSFTATVDCEKHDIYTNTLHCTLNEFKSLASYYEANFDHIKRDDGIVIDKNGEIYTTKILSPTQIKDNLKSIYDQLVGTKKLTGLD